MSHHPKVGFWLRHQFGGNNSMGKNPLEHNAEGDGWKGKEKSKICEM